MKQRRSGSPGVALPFRWAVLILFLGLSCGSYASLSASLDRYRIAMGESVRLTLSSDDGSDPEDADLSALEAQFEVLESSTRQSMQSINGQRSQNRELLLELMPRREGTLIIPAFEVDGQLSNALSIEVSAEPVAQAEDEFVTFEAVIDRDSVYVQGQLLLTLRVQQAVNLESRSITELEIDNAYVEDLGQNSFQKMIDGRPWLVHEIRYAVFPQSSGEITIPVQTFSGRLGSGRRTLFDTRPSGRLIRRQSEELVIPVGPRPASFPDTTWLPATELALEEQWSGPVDQLQIGDSVTRTITLSGDGLQGAQLPPVELADIDGLRAYPDQPAISNVSGENGVTGLRTESLALVAVSAGEYELPAIEIPWWDTSSERLKVARLPARRVRVLPPVSPAADSRLSGARTIADGSPPAVQVQASASGAAGYWPWVAALCALGWLLTSAAWWYRGRKAQGSDAREKSQPRNSPKALLQACDANNAGLALRELRVWLRGQGHLGTIDEWLAAQGSNDLRAAVAALERQLYYEGEGSVPWDGRPLSVAVRALPAVVVKADRHDGLPPLYLGQ